MIPGSWSGQDEKDDRDRERGVMGFLALMVEAMNSGGKLKEIFWGSSMLQKVGSCSSIEAMDSRFYATSTISGCFLNTTTKTRCRTDHWHPLFPSRDSKASGLSCSRIWVCFFHLYTLHDVLCWRDAWLLASQALTKKESWRVVLRNIALFRVVLSHFVFFCFVLLAVFHCFVTCVSILCLPKLALQSLDRPGLYTLSVCVLLVFVSMPMLPRTNFISSCMMLPFWMYGKCTSVCFLWCSWMPAADSCLRVGPNKQRKNCLLSWEARKQGSKKGATKSTQNFRQ